MVISSFWKGKYPSRKYPCSSQKENSIMFWSPWYSSSLVVQSFLFNEKLQTSELAVVRISWRLTASSTYSESPNMRSIWGSRLFSFLLLLFQRITEILYFGKEKEKEKKKKKKKEEKTPIPVLSNKTEFFEKLDRNPKLFAGSLEDDRISAQGLRRNPQGDFSSKGRMNGEICDPKWSRILDVFLGYLRDGWG